MMFNVPLEIFIETSASYYSRFGIVLRIDNGQWCAQAAGMGIGGFCATTMPRR